MCSRRGRRRGSWASRTKKKKKKKERFVSLVWSGRLRERLRRSMMHTKLSGAFEIGGNWESRRACSKLTTCLCASTKPFLQVLHGESHLKTLCELLNTMHDPRNEVFVVIRFLHQLEARFHKLSQQSALQERSWFVLCVDVGLNSFVHTTHVSATMVARHALSVNSFILKS